MPTYQQQCAWPGCDNSQPANSNEPFVTYWCQTHLAMLHEHCHDPDNPIAANEYAEAYTRGQEAANLDLRSDIHEIRAHLRAVSHVNSSTLMSLQGWHSTELAVPGKRALSDTVVELVNALRPSPNRRRFVYADTYNHERDTVRCHFTHWRYATPAPVLTEGELRKLANRMANTNADTAATETTDG